MILLKLIANIDIDFTQRELASGLCISLSEVNAGIKRLLDSGLVAKIKGNTLTPILRAAEQFLIGGLKYMIPGKLGEYTQGIPTAYAAPLFADKISLGDDPIPVWPDAYGTKKGVALAPIYPSITKALRNFPDENFYELLVLIDAIRVGRARERNIAIEILRGRLSDERQ